MNKAQQFWDKHAKRFDANEKQFHPVNRKILAKTREYLRADDRVLDFGCATGSKTLQLSKGVKHIHGLDFAAGMIEEAIRKQQEANVDNVSFTQGTIFDRDLENASFDKIIAYAIIHLLEDSEKALQRIHELLKPGGLFISTTPCFREKMPIKHRLEVLSYRIMKRLGLFPLHLNSYTFDDLKKRIQAQHFRIAHAEKIMDGMTIGFIVAEKL